MTHQADVGEVKPPEIPAGLVGILGAEQRQRGDDRVGPVLELTIREVGEVMVNGYRDDPVLGQCVLEVGVAVLAPGDLDAGDRAAGRAGQPVGVLPVVQQDHRQLAGAGYSVRLARKRPGTDPQFQVDLELRVIGRVGANQSPGRQGRQCPAGQLGQARSSQSGHVPRGGAIGARRRHEDGLPIGAPRQGHPLG